MYKNLLLLLGLMLVPRAMGAKYNCSEDKTIDYNSFIVESEVEISKGCKYNDPDDEDKYLYLNLGTMVQDANTTGRDNVSVTIDSTVFEDAGLRIDASSLYPVPAGLMHIPFLFSMTRSNLSRSDGSASVFYVEGVLPYGSNITLRDNWFSAQECSYIFEGGYEGFSLTKASVFVLANNKLELVGGGDYSECVWHQSSNLSITDDSHVIWSNNTIDVTGSRWDNMYGLYLEESNLTLTGNSSLEMRGNIMVWRIGEDTKDDHINIQLLASDGLSASDATVTIEDNNITTGSENTILRYLWEVKNSGNNSKVTPGFMLYVAGDIFNKTALTVDDVRTKFLSPTELLLTYNGTTSNDKPADSGNNGNGGNGGKSGDSGNNGDNGMTGLAGEEDTTNNTSTGVIAPAHTVGVLALALCLLACLY